MITVCDPYASMAHGARTGHEVSLFASTGEWAGLVSERTQQGASVHKGGLVYTKGELTEHILIELYL